MLEANLTMEQRLSLLLTPRSSKYGTHAPTVKQQAFLLLDTLEAFYGGAAGGGKSDALLMGALQYCDTPGYSALLLRRSYAELSKPGALMDRAHQWLTGTDAIWNAQEHKYTFPSGAVLSFGHVQYEATVYEYQSAEYQYIGFDELTTFTEFQYRFLMSRLRRLAGVDIPLRARAASNPGGTGHEWVKGWFVNPGDPNRPFIPARLEDNPHLDQEEYEKALALLPPVLRAKIREGDWDVSGGGLVFQRPWFRIVDAKPNDLYPEYRYWDLAGTAPMGSNDPDWTAGARMGIRPNRDIYITDMMRFRADPGTVKQYVSQTAQLDGKPVRIRIEREPGQSGKAQIADYQKALLGYDVQGRAPGKDKVTRAGPLASYAQAGNVYLVRGPWLEAFLDEVDIFPIGPHDDQVDAVDGGFAELAQFESGAVHSYR